MYINWNKRHPHVPTRPMIYWDVILLLLPSQLGGADIGVILGVSYLLFYTRLMSLKSYYDSFIFSIFSDILFFQLISSIIIEYIIPETILVLFAIVVLMMTAFLTLIKGLKLFDKETKELFSEDITQITNENTNNIDDDDDNDNDEEGHRSSDRIIYSDRRSPRVKYEYQENKSFTFGETRPLIQSQPRENIPPLNIREIQSIEHSESLSDRFVPYRNTSGTNEDNNLVRLNRSTSGDSVADVVITQEALIVPWKVIAIILASWMVYALLYVLMNDVTTCSIEYFIFLGCIYPILVIEVCKLYFIF